MAAFLEDLWTSIFTPGPTSTLLLATNVSFAALQSILLALLFATYSIHFVVLSILSAALWAGINWFAKEVMIAQAQQQAEGEMAGKVVVGRGEGISSGEAVEPIELPAEEVRPRLDITSTSRLEETIQAWNTGAAAMVAPAEGDALHQRRAMSASIELSTDGEWEKIEDER